MDTILFIELIKDAGAVETSVRERDGIVSALYTGSSNRSIPICISDEEIDDEIVKGHLRQLGYSEMIERLGL